MRTAPEFTGTDRYAVDEAIGRGSFGVVYRAFDHVRNETVALKLLKNLDAERLLAFKREFRSLADVSHPNVVSLYELISLQSDWFFTMELIEGVNFLHHVAPTLTPEAVVRAGATTKPSMADEGTIARRRRPITHRFDQVRLQQSFAQLVDGTRALHRSGQLHRDLKPSNAMVTPSGRVVLLDFGLVAAVGETPAPAHRVEGTVPYMSPEQCRGDALTPASDFYAIGVMLYEALTGRWPFEGRMRAVLNRKQQVDPPRPRALLADVPPELDELCMRLLARDPAERPDAEAVLRELGVTTQPPSSRKTDSRRPIAMVGRDDELARLALAFADVAGGKPHAVFVRGPSGIGKTELIQHFTGELERSQRAVVLRGACYQRESVPYKALDSFMDALSSHLERLPPDEIARLLPRQAQALARLFPVLEGVAAANVVSHGVAEVDALRRRAIDALRELMTRLGDRRPLVLCLDDMQWGDGDSARLLEDLVSTTCPSMMMVFCSSDEERGFVRSVRRSLERQPTIALSQIDVGPLHPRAAERMATELLADDRRGDLRELATAIAEESRGSPFFIRELVAYLAEVPEARDGEVTASVEVRLSGLLGHRIARLSAEARRLLETVAVAGRPIPERLAARAAELEDVRVAAKTLRHERLGRRSWDGSRADFDAYHDRIRRAVVDGLEPTRRCAIHGALADAFIQDGEHDVEAIAHHLRGAGRTERAQIYTVRAAARAFDSLAFERAAQLYALAVAAKPPQSPQRSELGERLAVALAHAGRGPESARAYLAATEGAPTRRRVTLRCRAAEQYSFSGHLDEATKLFHEVLASIGLPALPSSDIGALLAFGRRRAALKWRGLGYRIRQTDRIDPSELDRVDICYSVSAVLAGVRPLSASSLQTYHLQLALDLGEPFRIARGLSLEAVFTSMAGPSAAPDARTLLAEARHVANIIDEPQTNAVLGLASGICAFFMGQWERARTQLQATEQLIVERCPGMAFELRQVQSFNALAAFYIGDYAEAGARAASILRDLRARGDRYAESILANVTYRSLLFGDHVEQARREVSQALSGWYRGGTAVQDFYEKLALTRLAIYEGDGRVAYEIIERNAGAILRSANGRVQLIRVETHQLRAQAALLFAGQIPAGRKRNKLLAVVERAVARMDREHSATATAWALLLRAGLAARRHRREHARLLLIDAEHACRAQDLGGHAWAAAHQRSTLDDSQASHDLRKEAVAWMKLREIARPDRFAALMAPGFGGERSG
jgi:eukaryotic-like serine/threonine-protein kinase